MCTPPQSGLQQCVTTATVTGPLVSHDRRQLTAGLAGTDAAGQLLVLSSTASMCQLRSLLPLLLTAALTDGDAVYPGTCPNFPGVSDFNLKRFAGRWYISLSDEAPGSESPDKCVMFDFYESPSGSLIVTEAGSIQGNEFSFNAQWNITLTDGKAELVIIDNGEEMYRAKVLEVDYDKHATLWSCSPLPGGGIPEYNQGIAILTRNKSLDSHFKESMKVIFKLHGGRADFLTEINQSDCSGRN